MALESTNNYIQPIPFPGCNAQKRIWKDYMEVQEKMQDEKKKNEGAEEIVIPPEFLPDRGPGIPFIEGYSNMLRGIRPNSVTQTHNGL